MGGPARWIGARICLRINAGAADDIAVEGHIATAEDIGDGITRVSGVFASGGWFVLATNEAVVR